MPESSPPSTPRQIWQPPTAEELQALLPQYEISEILGRGGMGAVYKGRQIALDRPVAIKILSNLLDEADASFAERFKNEARAMGRIMHPGVVAVFDFGETPDGLLYIVMEFVEGTDVSRMLAREKRLPAEHALAITAHVLDALAYAHARGIIHRDIKPANVMVGYDGVVKVADFGLAKMSQDGHSGLTQSGTAMGTLHYMAPEALMLGTSVDHRADIYAVGVMLYQMLTGRLPQGMFELPSTQVPGLDPRYDGIIARALRDDRELRYQSASEMRQALDAILTQPVAKVEAEATRAPAALPTTARPQPGAKQQPYLPPPSAKSASAPASSTRRALVWVALLVLVMFGGLAWLVFAPPWEQNGALQTAGEPASTQEVNLGPQSAAVTKEAPFTNTLGMKFVPVPGTNVMFCIHETRYKDYAAYADEAASIDGSWKNQTHYGYAITERAEAHPVVNVSWEDAQAFCAWLSKKEGKTYRLPTDQEWSYAVGIGWDEKWKKDTTPATVTKSQTDFPWGDKWPPPKGSGNYSDQSRKAKTPSANAQYLENYDDGFPTTAPVMSFKPNQLGLYDLEGNVREWVDDWYDNAKAERVLRGSSWSLVGRPHLLSSQRGHHVPGYRHSHYGFRCVLMMPSGAATASTPIPIPPPVVKPLAPAGADPKDAHTNTLGMKFVPVPGTDVLFCIHETRYKDYAAYAAENPSVNSTWKNQTYDGFAITERNDDHPVTHISWEDAKAFCAWLSKKEGKTYRLPTDAEWSIAVGVGRDEKWEANTTPATVGKNKTDFPWGDQWPPPQGSGNFSDQSHKAKAPHGDAQYIDDYDDGFPTTAPVMRFSPNKLGIHDLGGNVWEWCEDWHDNTQVDRVLRGGGWGNGIRGNLLSSFRGHYPSGHRHFNHGFRLVLADTPDAVSVAPNSSTLMPTVPSNPSSKATKEQPLTNTLGMKFVPVPGTEVLFCIHETRYKDYAAYAAENPSVDKAWKNQTYDGFAITERNDDHPVTQISWVDAKAFCAWLSKKEGKTYRLPTDEEWSMAVGMGSLEKRSPTTTPAAVTKPSDAFPWGTDWPPPEGCGNFSDESRKSKAPNAAEPCLEKYDDGFPTTAPVMSFAPTPLGLFDLDGNVREWVEDWWDENRKERVLRGAGWGDGDRPRLLSSRRGHPLQDARYNVAGFRVVMVIEGPSRSAPRSSGTSAASTGATSDILKNAPQAQPFVNTLGMKFVPVPGTEVLFCIHETRYKDYAAYAAEARDVGQEWKDQSAGDFTPSGSENLPVVRVSWEDAQKFCRWLSKKEGKRYRLPTDREWSLAVGVGAEEKWQEGMMPASVFKDQNKFPWGTQWPPPPGAGNYSDASRNVSVPSGDPAQYLQNYNDGFPAMAPVMSFKVNALGLYDMGGNVWEWVEDWYDHSRQNRVLRGGSWRAGKREHMLSSHRARGIPDAHDFNYGFRLVLVRDDAPGPVPHLSAALSISPAKTTQAQPFVNTLGMKFVPVPGTEVFFCIHETRRQDYAAYAAVTSGVNDAWKKQSRHGIPCGDKDDHPVCGISWEDAKAFCFWLSKKESASYRLPTDQEWSIAVGAAGLENRGLSTTPEELAAVELDHYPWGTEPVMWTEDKLGNYQDNVWKEISAEVPTTGKYRDGFLTSAPVMSFRPNAFGLYDLGGNVWEWVEDDWNAEHTERLLRGGSFLDYNPAKIRSSGRAHHPPGYRSAPFGFRVALVPTK